MMTMRMMVTVRVMTATSSKISQQILMHQKILSQMQGTESLRSSPSTEAHKASGPGSQSHP